MIVLDKKYPASPESMRDIHADLKAALTRLNYNDSAQDPFLLSASEIFTNALKHTENSPSFFKVTLSMQATEMHFTLVDDGSPFEHFDMMRQESENQSAKMEDGVFETGGIGLFLSGRDFDEFSYERVNDWNYYNLKLLSSKSKQKPLILIIDDDPAQRDLVTLYIAEAYDVAQAESGQAALEWLKNTDQAPDLILCDVIMRDGDGIEFCRTLQGDKARALIPFIFMTGKPDDLTAQIAEDLPVNDFLKKPVQKAELLKTLKRTLTKTAHDQKILGDKLDADITSALSPALPSQIGAYKTALKWQEAEAGGGDIVLHLPGHECDHIIVIDVMGHGAQAKFFSHSFAGYLHGFLSAQSQIQEPGEILSALSRFLHNDKIGEKTILTAQIVSIFKDGALKIASAGHPLPFLQDETGIDEIEIEGAMPGLTPDAAYSSIGLRLDPQQRLILYTDGLMEVGEDSEAMAAHTENILTQIKAQYQNDLNESANNIWSYFLEKTDGTPGDDALFIMLQRD